MNNTYKIKPVNLVALEEKIAKLNRKAAKLGCEPAVVTVIGEEMVKASRVMPGGRILKYEYEVKLVTVTGDTPKLEGWSLIAKVEYLDDARLILCVPGEECPEEFRTRGTECDHCKSKRQRKNVFVLQKGDEYVQVGRTCIKDFLGGVSPEQLLSRATWNFNVVEACGDYEEGGCGGRAPESIDITEYLNATAICIRRLGWLSKSACQFNDESSTASDAWDLVKPDCRNEKDREVYEKWVEKMNLVHQERDETTAADALKWAVSQPVEGVGDYLYNLGVACRAGYVTRRTMGIVASAVSAYMRAMAKVELNQKQKDTEKSREWVGEVKVRQDFTGLTVLSMRYIEGNYGTTTLVAFEDEPGNLIKWFASVELDNINKGDVVDLKATVKKHDDYKRVKQTLITRAKINTINGEAA
jgi:hypothetical protein